MKHNCPCHSTFNPLKYLIAAMIMGFIWLIPAIFGEIHYGVGTVERKELHEAHTTRRIRISSNPFSILPTQRIPHATTGEMVLHPEERIVYFRFDGRLLSETVSKQDYDLLKEGDDCDVTFKYNWFKMPIGIKPKPQSQKPNENP